MPAEAEICLAQKSPSGPLNTATFAIGPLTQATGESLQDWLQQMALETRPPPGSMDLDYLKALCLALH